MKNDGEEDDNYMMTHSYLDMNSTSRWKKKRPTKDTQMEMNFN